MSKDIVLQGLVLAGGQSERMGSDKALLRIHGKTQLEYCFEILAPLCDQVYLSVRPDQATLDIHRRFPQIHDQFSGIGPLAGILSAQMHDPMTAWLVLACDLPFVDRGVLEILIRNRNPKKFATAYRNADDPDLPEPLCAIYEPSSAKVLKDFVERGIHCPRKILLNTAVELLTQPNLNALDNVNTADDLSRVRTRSASGKTMQTIHVAYYAQLREYAGVDQETLLTSVATPRDLYAELSKKYSFKLSTQHLKAAVNDQFVSFEANLSDNDRVVFIPPVAGG